MNYKSGAFDQSDKSAFGPRQRDVTLFFSGTTARRNADLAIHAVGARLAGACDLPDALALLDRQPAGDAIVVEIDEDGGSICDQLLERLETMAQTTGQPVVLSVCTECLDLVSARVLAPSIVVLVDADTAERIAALTLALVPPDFMLREAATDLDALRLQRLADEVGRIARTLAEIAGLEGPAASTFGDPPIGFRAQPPANILAADVRGIIRMRRLRERYFPSELFADPAWDMLLDLIAARIDKLRVAVSSLCIAAAVPPTTALRWMKSMTEAGMLIRVADPADARRVFIELSEATATAMLAYLTEAKGKFNV